jgi:acetylornithine/succinyldiaminopimelate/putrescine aminotransferase
VPLLIVTTAKSAANGQPLALTLMPKEIAQAAYPLTQITTNQMNGPLLRALVAAEVLRNPQLQAWFLEKGKQIEEIAASYDIPLGEKGLRGKFLNRGVYVGNNGNVKLAQIALLVEDGVLVGALPEAIRYQPMLLEFSETNQLVAHIIFRRIKKVLEGDISKDVLHIYRKMENLSSGLAR